MLRAKNIIYGFCSFTNPPKYKYLISLYRSETLNVVAVFPTSKQRSGSLCPKHGRNYRGQDIVSYVFEPNRCIGKKYNSDECFSFPLITTIPFDYCFQEGEQENILKSLQSPQIVGILSDEEYVEILYAFSKSPLTPRKYLPIFEEILKEYCSKE